MRKFAHTSIIAGMATKTRLTGPMSKRLRTAREDAGLSPKALSFATGLALRTVHYYEDPNYHRARKAPFVKSWAEATGREFQELWGGNDPSEHGIASTRCTELMAA